MQNFNGTEWEGLTEEEIFLSNQKLVRSTIKKQFPNSRAFCDAHCIEFDDLIQMGNIGLLYAIRDYKNNGKSSFRTFAINNISWAITTQSKSESLRNINTQTFELANVVSADMKVENGEGEEVSIVDTISSSDNTSEQGDSSVLTQQVTEFLKNDPDVDDKLLFILTQRMSGESLDSIGKQLGVHRNSIAERLQTKRALRIKRRLKHFLENGVS
ncbi:sigma-70 family RNA polymerase sigma factor [Lysinibacillus xylanilyticus]|uniref:sigma-70 family RNA polymerase sigma factor n=1 Tax=Lysinibacillus xylanilyticus TaxID=582475 RepID=UPI00381ED9A5